MYSLNNEGANLPVRLHSVSALCRLHMQNAGFFHFSVSARVCLGSFQIGKT